jgi:ATP-dependent Lon protease
MPSHKVKDSRADSKHKQVRKKAVDSSSESDIDSDDYETLSDSDDDSSYVPPKSSKNKKKRRSSREEEEEEDDEEEDDEEEENIDRAELQNLISKIFPSKYISNRAKETKKSQHKISKKSKTDKKSSKKQAESESEESDAESDDYYEDSEEDDEDYDDEEEQMFNIILMGGGGDNDTAEEYIEDNADCDSDDEKMFMKEKFVNDIDTKDGVDISKKRRKNKKKSREEEDEADVELTDVEQEYLDLVETKKTLVAQLNKKPASKVLKNAVEDCKHSIMRLVKKARNKNAKVYHKLIHNDKKKANEIDYFKKKLSNKEQLRAMHDLKEINKHINIDKPYRLALLDTNMPAKFKAVAMQRLNVLRMMEPGDPEFYKIKNWVDTFMKIPFGIYRSLSVNISDGIDICHDFMDAAKTQLDNCVYGLDDAKLQIMQMMGQWISNPSAMGTAIAIKGPMGTGKTTLVKEGISKILGREFSFIALGGNSDSSFLEGHSYTYEGSSWGKIVQLIIESKCMNPVIYFDELDKVSDTPRGEEIIGILTHLTDTTQNSQFHDKYFSEVEFDLSKCLFIFSYNDESKVNPILRDRMYRIQTKGYESKEKLIIARNHLLPKIREQVGFNEEDVIIPDETINYIVSCEHLTAKEQGVRNLKRCLEIIHTKLNLFRLVRKESTIFDKSMDIEISFPITVSQKHVDVFIKKEEDEINQSMLAMYI